MRSGVAAGQNRAYPTSRHNNTGGTYGYCDAMIETLLPANSMLTVVPPEGSVPANSRAKADPTTYVGNPRDPKLPNTTERVVKEREATQEVQE